MKKKPSAFRKALNKYLLFPLDTLLAGLLTLAWGVLLTPLMLLRPLLYGKIRPTKTLLLSFEGHKVAPTRVRCYHFAKGLEAAGMEAEVLAYWDTYKNLAHFPFPFRRIWETEKVYVNLRAFLTLLPMGPMIIFEQRPNYDFVVPLFLKLVNGSKIVMDIDDWILDYRVFSRVTVKHLLPFFGLYCDTCVCSSRQLQERLARHFKQTPLLPTYVDRQKFSPNGQIEAKKAVRTTRPSDAPVLFSWVGTVFQDFTYDNVVFMIEAFAAACDELNEKRNLRLEIVGGGDYFPKVKELLAGQYANYNIAARDWLPPDEMPGYLQGVDCGLYALVEDSLFHKSKSPTKIFEYYACGRPVVSTTLGEAQYFVEHGVTGLLASDVPGYAQAIAAIYRDAESREAMGRAGRAKIDSLWNLDAAGRELKTLLTSA